MKIIDYISSQCKKPQGTTGNFMCRLMNIFNGEMYKSLSALIKTDKSAKILEIGYGNGKLTEMIYAKNKCIIYGIDISEDMRKAASERNKAAVISGKVRLSVGDCCNLEFDDDMFDIVATMNTIYFWSDTLKGLQEIRRVLKDGGVFYNAVYSKKSLQELPYTLKNFSFFETEEYVKLGKKAGFSRVGVKAVDEGDIYIIKYIK